MVTFSHADAGTNERGWRLEERHANIYGTSGRTVAPAPHGFGANLRALGVETAAALRSS
ncbi:UNVERIFIED_ORG: hypothetical protein J2X79_000791 [Arthrobacter globiformis]|nr:hypothetical protein [Arthrobacter globiformis]